MAQNTQDTWLSLVKSAYDYVGKANYRDNKGNIIEGIYTDLENEVYHSLLLIVQVVLRRLPRVNTIIIVNIYLRLPANAALLRNELLKTRTLGKRF